MKTSRDIRLPSVEGVAEFVAERYTEMGQQLGIDAKFLAVSIGWETTYTHLLGFGSDEGQAALVALHDDDIVRIVALASDRPGGGTYLLVKCIETVAATNKAIIAEIAETNERAIRIFERAGFDIASSASDGMLRYEFQCPVERVRIL